MADHLVGGLRCADVTDLAASFVLGALEPAESDAVRVHLAGCPEAHAEVAELGSVVPALFESVDVVAPPGALRDRILAAAAADQAAAVDAVPTVAPPAAAGLARTPAQAPTPAAPRAIEAKRTAERPRSADVRGSGDRLVRLFGRSAWAAAGIAAALALVAMGVWNLQLRDEISGLTAYRNGVVEVLEEAARPGAQLAVLAAEEAGGPSGLAAIAADGSVALVMRDLAPTSGTQVYEAWLIAGNDAPVPIGGFRVGADGSAAFSTDHGSLGSGVTVALTLEPAPGATAPTAPIIASGIAAAQPS